MIRPRFYFIKEDGKWEWPEEAIQYFLRSLPRGRYEIIIKKPARPKSDQQRKYYWGCMMKMVGDETGSNPLEVHEFCKEEFLPLDRDSTEQLSTIEEEDYHTKIRVYFAREFGITIPLPNESDY